MNHEASRSLPSNASIILLGIFLALVIQSGLDNFLGAVLVTNEVRHPIDLDALRDGFKNGSTVLLYAQMVTFIMLLSRFYLGAFRFNLETGSASQPKLIDNVVDFVGTGLLFIAFYALSKTLSTTGDFYLITLITHGADAIWFVAVIFLLLKGTELLGVARWYILWDVITVAWFAGCAWLLGTERSDYLLQWMLLLGLAVISCADWWILRDFYFAPAKWRMKPVP